LVERALSGITENGFPNYFGPQRFGHNGQNLVKGWQLLSRRRLSGHAKKGIYLSALRSFLFNQILAQRIDNNTLSESEDECGPLWGRGRASVSEQQQIEEANCLLAWKPLSDALEYSGLRQERRKLLCEVTQLKWCWQGDDQLQLTFELPPGSYATSLLAELAVIVDGSDADRYSPPK